MLKIFPIFAQQSLPPTYEAARWAALSGWWQYALVAAVAMAALGMAWAMVRRDSVELRPGVGWFLLGCRIGALVGLAAFFVGYEKRVDRQEVYPSRAFVLVDTSLSMAQTDTDDATAASKNAASRIEQAAAELADGKLLDQLRQRHRVEVLSFDQDAKPTPVASLDRLGAIEMEQPASAGASDSTALNLDEVLAVVPKPLWQALIAAAGVSLVLGIVWMWQSAPTAGGSIGHWFWAVAGCLMPVVPIVVLIALVVEERNVVDENESTPEAIETATIEKATDKAAPAGARADWKSALHDKLKARGAETRLGQAVKQLVHDERANPVSGVVVLTDGGQNAGIDVAAAAKDAKEAGVKVFAVGLGSDRKPANVRISDFVAPSRAYPSDNFTVTAFVQAVGLADRTVSVELSSVAGAGKLDGDPKQEKQEDTARVKLAADGEVVPVKFALTPAGLGRRTYIVRVQVPPEDRQPKDNVALATVDVVERKLRVLLFAGAPSREYQFLRNQLRRDKDVVVDVLLQTAQGVDGVSQDANEVLTDFPATKADLAKYDCLVAFDPDWTKLDATDVDVLEDWVATQAGGVIALAGPVNTAAWASDPKAPSAMAKIRAVYPVVFPRQIMRFDHEKFRSQNPWPIELSRAGREAPFLWLDDSPAGSQQAWNAFSGVFGYFPVRGAKPGATVYGRYSDPAAGEPAPVYFAGHFYGAGRVFYLGSGEMWRIRGLEEGYFEQFYTKLTRYVSEGRLLRGSKHGSLLLEKQKFVLGDVVEVRAQLQDARLEPLDAKQATLQIVDPGRTARSVALTADPTRKGLFRGQFPVAQEGRYQLELTVPGLASEVLSSYVEAAVPNLEKDHSIRNDKLLRALADETGGKYYVGLAAIRGPADGLSSLAEELKDATAEGAFGTTPR